MALSGTITGKVKGYTLQAAWSAVQNVNGNYSDVTVTHKLVIDSGYSLKVSSRSNSCSVDGVSKTYQSGSINQKGGTVTLGSTTHRVQHNNDGSKSCTLTDAFNLNATIDGTKISTITASGSITLDTIGRYATVTSADDFTDSGTPTLGYANPAGFSVDAYLEFNPVGSGTQIMRTGAITAKSGSYSFALSDAERDELRAACTGNSMPVRYVLRTIISGKEYYSHVDRTMSVSDAAPILGTASYKDANSAVVAVTGNDQLIVQNQSDLQVTFDAAAGQKGATISSYTLTFAGVSKTVESAGTVDFGKVDVSSSQNLTLTATDSRGITASKTLAVTVEQWWTPTATVDLQRVNNFESTTHITATAWYAPVDSKNSVTMSVKYRKAGTAAWSDAVALTSGIQATVTCDRDYAYDFIVTVSDRFASTGVQLSLGKGIPLFFLDTKHSSVGVNCLPTQDDVLQIGESAWLTAQGAYPVGSIYMSVNEVNPAQLFGGTWKRLGGRFLLGADTTYPAGSTGGEAEHTLTIDEMPKHNHGLDNYNASGNATPFLTVQHQDKIGYGGNVQTMYTGGSQPHNNMPPYLTVFMWQRTA